MYKFAKALILSLVIAAPVAISIPQTQAEAAVSSITPAAATENNAPLEVSHNGTYTVARVYHRRPVRHYHRPVRHYHRAVRRHHW